MRPQVDYETEPTLAVFRSAEQAAEATLRLERSGVPARSIARIALTPGRYQAEDDTFAEEKAGVRRGVLGGAPIGAAIGLAVAAVISAGVAGIAGLAAAGAIEGAVIGGFVGSIARASFDEDTASTVDVHSNQGAVVVVVRSGGVATDVVRVRESLRRAGAIAFLDPTSFPDIDAQD
jgi:hypothetical protein